MWGAGGAAIAGLHSLRKGANRTPPLRRPAVSGAAAPARPAALGNTRAPAAGGRIRQPEERTQDVTTVSSAEQHTRRDFLYIATGAVAAVGGVAALVPLVAQMNPDASTVAAGAPVDIDLSPISQGQIVKVFWRSKPIFIFNRTPKEIQEAKAVDVNTLRDPATDAERTKPGHEQWLVVIGICTHLGCIPLAHQGEYDGWFCPCHGSQYDTAGRIRKGPAPKNLYLPPYTFLSATKIRIGEESTKPA